MPKYYDINKLKEMIEAKADTLIACKKAFLYVAKWLDMLPSADVVARSDVERLQSQVNRLKKYDEERDIRLHTRLIANAKSEVSKKILDEIEEEIVAALESNCRVRGELLVKKDIPYEMVACINGKINALRGIEGFVENLKKKYVEGEG